MKPALPTSIDGEKKSSDEGEAGLTANMIPNVVCFEYLAKRLVGISPACFRSDDDAAAPWAGRRKGKVLIP